MGITKTRLTVLGYLKELGSAFKDVGSTLIENEYDDEIIDFDNFENSKLTAEERETFENIKKIEWEIKRATESKNIKKSIKTEGMKNNSKVEAKTVKNEREEKIRG